MLSWICFHQFINFIWNIENTIQNREKRNKRKRQKRKLNSTYAQWNERQTCLKTNSVNYTRSMFLLFRTNKAKRRYCREQKRETVVEHREKRRVASRANKEKTGAERVPRTLPGIRISRSTRAHKAADTRGSGRYARFGSFRANGERRPWQSAAIKGTLMERFDCRTDQLPFSSFLFFSIFFPPFSAFFPFFFFFRWNDTRKEIDNLMIVDKIDSTIVR